MLTKLYVKAACALEAKKQRGVTAIEYAIIGVAVSAVVLAVFSGSGDGSLKGALDSAMGTIKSNIGKAGTVTSG